MLTNVQKSEDIGFLTRFKQDNSPFFVLEKLW